MSVTLLTTAMVTRLRTAVPTYREVGATAGELPSGYRHLRRTVRVGAGSAAFEAAAEAVLGWQVQLRAGLRVAASSATVRAGTVVTLGFGRLVTAPCRVVYVVEDPRRRGFAYGTLPGHPERGEESFVVEHHGDGTVSFTVTAFSRPATPLARAAGPLGVAVQRWITGRYLRALVS